MIKKMLMSFLITVFILGYVFPVSAQQLQNEVSYEINEKYITKESPMPSSTYLKSAMKSWKEETAVYLENFHKQKISEIIEDERKVVFFYETDSTILHEQIISTEYYKSSQLSRYIVGDTKIDTYSNWSNGARPTDVDFKSASNMLAASAIAISLVRGVSVKLSAVISSVAAYVGWVVDSNLPVKAETRVVGKYFRKVGSYFLDTGVWYPNVQIGRVEYWYYRTAYQPAYSGGPYIPHHYDNIPNSMESNYDTSDFKPYYYDNTWIINKSVQIGNSPYAYVDIFG